MCGKVRDTNRTSPSKPVKSLLIKTDGTCIKIYIILQYVIQNSIFLQMRWPCRQRGSPNWRAQVRGSPGETLTCTLMILVHVKSVMVAMFSKFPFKLYLWRYRSGRAISLWQIKILMACLRTILRDESQTHYIALV